MSSVGYFQNACQLCVAAGITWFPTDISTETREVFARALHEDAQLITVENDRLARHFDLNIIRTGSLCGAILVKRRQGKTFVKVILFDLCCIRRYSSGQLSDTRL